MEKWGVLLLLGMIVPLVYSCLPNGKSSKVSIGFDTYVCVTLAPLNWGNNGSVIRVPSQLKADTLSSVNVKQCK